MDTYPNDGAMFDEEIIDEQTEEENRERADTQASAPIVNELIEDIQQWIKDAELDAAKSLDIGMTEIEMKAVISGTKRYVTKMQAALDKLTDKKGRYLEKQ